MTSPSDFDQAILHDVAERTAGYLSGLDDRPVFPTAASVDALEQLPTTLPEGPSDPAETVALLDDLGSPATVASMGRRYFGFVTGGVLPAALGASWLASGWDQNAALGVMSPVAAHLDRVAISWLIDLFGLPATAGGSFVTGATMANFTGLIAGRDRVLREVGWDVAADGLFGAPPITVVVGEEAHSTIAKSLSMAGLGRDRVVRLPVGEQGTIRTEAVGAIDGPTIVILQAGNVNSGGFDPFAEIIPAVRDSGAWVHVDGAFGLWAALSEQRHHLVDGVEHADSWAVDAHKWLNSPYDCGVALFRDAGAVVPSMHAAAPYLGEPEAVESMHRSPESSQRARGVEVWAALHNLGRRGVVDLVERCCRLARLAAERLAAAGFEVRNDVVLNQVVIGVGDDATTAAFLAALADDGTCWCGATTWRGRRSVRLSVSSWATTEADIDATVAAFVRAAGSSGATPAADDRA